MTLDFYFLLFVVRHGILLGRIITCRILASTLKSRYRKKLKHQESGLVFEK